MSKLVFINLPYWGHVLPTLGIVKELTARGHSICYICSADWQQSLEEAGAVFIPYILSETEKEQNIEQLCYQAAYQTACSLDFSYDILLYDAMFFLGQHLAKRLGKPAIRFFTSFAYNDSVIKDLIKKAPRSSILRHSKQREWYTSFLAGNISITEKDYLYAMSHNIADLNLVFCQKELQIYADEFDERFQFIGSVVSDADQNSTILPLPEGKIIYISLGTQFYENVSFYDKCIHAFSNSAYHLVFSAGNPHILHQIEEKMQPNMKAYVSVPQKEILKHCALFITHGGANSIQEALANQVPMAVYPIDADQPVNADLVAQLHFGIRLKPDILPEDLFQQCEQTIESTDIHEHLLAFHEKYQKENGIRKAVCLIENFIEQQKGESPND